MVKADYRDIAKPERDCPDHGLTMAVWGVRDGWTVYRCTLAPCDLETWEAVISDE